MFTWLLNQDMKSLWLLLAAHKRVIDTLCLMNRYISVNREQLFVPVSFGQLGDIVNVAELPGTVLLCLCF